MCLKLCIIEIYLFLNNCSDFIDMFNGAENFESFMKTMHY